MNGAVHTIRDMGEVAFVILRKREGLLQCVYEEGVTEFDLKELKEASAVEIAGRVNREERAPHGFEIRIRTIRILSEPAKALPLQISKWKLNTSLDAKLNHRAVSLREISGSGPPSVSRRELPEDSVIFFTARDLQRFIRRRSGPKAPRAAPNLFKLEYFHRPAILQQSPQFYKQMMVGVFDRVFETAPVFRAEKHNTKRHLNEYTSLDFEMGYIDSFEDLMEMETGFLQYTMKLLEEKYAEELRLLNIQLPNVESIPQVRFDEAKQMVAEKYHRQFRNPFDLEPEEEYLIGELFQEDYGADFVFVTHYPSKKRPFYAMDDPSDPVYTLSFDLLFHGLEVTTGGQRIHDYHALLEKIEKRKMETEGMEHYLSAFQYGMPPHGGLGIGLERLTMQLIGEDNVREATLFPRDLSRLEP